MLSLWACRWELGLVAVRLGLQFGSIFVNTFLAGTWTCSGGFELVVGIDVFFESDMGLQINYTFRGHALPTK